MHVGSTVGICLYNIYEDLKVESDKFTVTLDFNGSPFTVIVPFASIHGFILGEDPSTITELYPKDLGDNVIDFQERRASF